MSTGISGSKGSSSGSQSDAAATTLAKISEGFSKETAGLRTGFINQLMGILSNPSGKIGFDQAGYDAAVEKYNTDTAAWEAGDRSGSSQPSGTVPWYKSAVIPNAAPVAPVAPKKSDFQRGGGVQVPIIAQALEASRRAGSQAQSGTRDELARTGLVGTPFGQSILSQGKRENSMNVANTQTDVMKTLYGMLPNFVLGQSQTALSGLSGAVGGNVKASGDSKNTGAGFGRGK
jgi:hypothetical protein